MFRNVTLKCLTEIAGVTVTNYDAMFITLFSQTMTQLEQVCGIEISSEQLQALQILWELFS